MDMENKKPFLRRSNTTGKIYAGFLNVITGKFEIDREIDFNDENGVEKFMDDYNLTVVMITKID